LRYICRTALQKVSFEKALPQHISPIESLICPDVPDGKIHWLTVWAYFITLAVSMVSAVTGANSAGKYFSKARRSAKLGKMSVHHRQVNNTAAKLSSRVNLSYYSKRNLAMYVDSRSQKGHVCRV